MTWKHNDRIISVGSSWISDDNWKHPYNWESSWTDENKKDFNVIWTDDPKTTTFDDRFYWDKDIERKLSDTLWVDNNDKAVIDNNTGVQGITLGLKSIWVATTKKTSNNLLSNSDWYVTRKAENATAIPSSISSNRTAIRSASETIETAINSCKKLDDFKKLFVVPMDSQKPPQPSGKAPIYNFPNSLS